MFIISMLSLSGDKWYYKQIEIIVFLELLHTKIQQFRMMLVSSLNYLDHPTVPARKLKPLGTHHQKTHCKSNLNQKHVL